jgi:hypothetical protein
MLNSKQLMDKNGRCNYQSEVLEKHGNKVYILSYITDDPMLRHEFLHREDGPARESANGNCQWWYEGEQIQCSSQEEFEKMLKLKAFW